MTVAGETHRTRLERIRDSSQALARAVDLETLFATLHHELVAALQVETFFLGLYDEVSRTIEVVRQADFETLLPGGTFPLGHGVTSEVIRTRQPRLIRRWSQEAPRAEVQYVSSTPGLPESALTVPLLVGDQVLGVIAVHKYQPDAFGDEDLLFLETIAAQSAMVITSLRRSEHLSTQLQTRLSELQAVLSTMADGVLILDASGRLVALNRAARALLSGGQASIVLGQPLEQQAWGQWPLGARELTDTLRPLLARVQAGEALVEAEVHLERPGRRSLSFSGTPLVDARERVVGCVLIVRDMTSYHQIEELKDEMLSVASHDLKTPVTVIRSQAQLLRRHIRAQIATMDQVDEGLGSIVEQTDRLAKLLTLLLDLSRIEAGRLELQRRRVDLGLLAATAIAEVQATTDRHQLQLHVVGRPTGHWDENRLHQVLANLLTNAVKYAPDGGPIGVAIQTDHSSVSLCVRDHGVGLTHEEAEHVFDRFFRAKAMRRLEGTGLGLYICRSIIAAHGGHIWVESGGRGRGSAFWLTLPRAETDPAITAPRTTTTTVTTTTSGADAEG